MALNNYQARPAALAYGRIGAGMGALCSALGAGLLLAGPRISHSPSARSPLIVILAVGASFFVAGLLLLIQGVKDIQLEKRLKVAVPSEKREPWLWDHAWNQSRIKSDTLNQILQGFGFAIFVTVFMVPFHWWAFYSGQGPWMVKIITLLFDLVVMGLLGKATSDALGLYLYGLHRLTLERFPFFMGSRLSVSVENSQALIRSQNLTAKLRCIQVDWQSVGSGSNATTVTRAFVLYEDSKNISSLDLQAMTDLTLPFELPEGNYGNRLLDRSPRYWELELTGQGGWKKFKATYLLPVYDNPASTESQDAAASAITSTEALSNEENRTKTQLIGALGLIGFLAGIFLGIVTPFLYVKYHRIVTTWPLVQAQLVSKHVESAWSYSNHTSTRVYFLDLHFRVLPNGLLATAQSPVRSSGRSRFENQLRNWQIGVIYSLRQHPRKPAVLSLIVTDQHVWDLLFPWILADLAAWLVYGAVTIRSKKSRLVQSKTAVP